MPAKAPQQLSRRERQIMDIIYARGRATAAEVLEAMADAPSYSAVRALLRVLEEKGQVRHRKEGARYVYTATRPKSRAARDALKRVLQTFYQGSTVNAVAALLEISDRDMTEDEIDRLERLVEDAKTEGS